MREKRETRHHSFSNTGAKLEISRITAFPVLVYQLSCAITPFWNRLTRYGVGAIDLSPCSSASYDNACAANVPARVKGAKRDGVFAGPGHWQVQRVTFAWTVGCAVVREH